MPIVHLEDLLADVKRINPHVRETPGLAQSEILEGLSEFDHLPTKELVSLYEWRNGIDELNAFTRVLSLGDAIGVYRLYRQLAEGLGSRFGWQEQWFPVVDINGDVQLCLDCKTLGLALVDMEGGVEELICDSYLDYVAALRDGFSHGLFIWNELHGCVETKDHEWQLVLGAYGIKDPYAR